MPVPPSEVIRFKRNHFSARLPCRYRYSLSHFWLDEHSAGCWRVGLTTFATRMLGDIVEMDFEIDPGAAVRVGDTIGWIEGFKAVSDVYCIVDGRFDGPNQAALERTDLVCADAYDGGWIYRVTGTPDPQTVDVGGYIEHLERTIDKMQEKPWQSPELRGT